MPRTKTVVTTREFEGGREGAAAPFSPGEPAAPPVSRDWWDYFDNILSQRDWATDGIKVYLYRISDDPTERGREGYLARFERPFDAEDVKKLPGFSSGNYSCHVKQGSKRIYVSAPFKIFGAAVPWADAPAAAGAGGGGGSNDAALNLLRPLVEQAAGQVATGVDLQKAVSNVLDMQSGAFSATLQAIAAAKAGAGGEDGIERAAKLFASMGLIRRPDEGATGGGFDRAVDTFSKLGLLKAPRSLAEEIGDVLAISERLGLNGRRGGGTSDWVRVAQELGPKILETGAKVVSDVRRITEVRAGMARAAAVVAGSAAPGAGAVRAAALPGRLDGAAGNGVEPGPGAAVQPGPGAAPAADPLAGPLMSAFDWLKAGARKRIGEGGSPEDLLQYLDTLSPELVDSLAAMSPVGLESFFEADPILRECSFAVAWGSRLDFLTRFLELATEGPADDGDAEGDGEGGEDAAGAEAEGGRPAAAVVDRGEGMV